MCGSVVLGSCYNPNETVYALSIKSQKLEIITGKGTYSGHCCSGVKLNKRSALKLPLCGGCNQKLP